MKRSIIGCLFFVFISCMNSIVSVPVLLDSRETGGAAVPDEWKKYGACYLYDELFIESSYYSSSWVSTPLNRIVFNKKLRILSKNGAARGNIPIPVYSRRPRAFRVVLTGPDGNRIELDNDKLREDYLRKEAIVVPNVTEGCEIAVYVEFETYSPITYHEFSFERDVPALVSRYTFSALSKLHYNFKAYNLNVEPVVEERPGTAAGYDYTYHRYELKNVLPQANLEYQGYVQDEARRVAVVLRRAMDSPIFTDWAGLAKNYREAYLTSPTLIPVKKIEKIISGVRESKSDTFAVADSLLQWVSENITQDDGGFDGIDISRVLDVQRGSLWEITVLLQQLFRQAGYAADIVVTRSRELGGFDRQFVAPMFLSVPIVVVTVCGREYAAFPFRRGGALGEYPEIFSGNDGLSMKNREPAALPPSTASHGGSSTSFTIDCRGDFPREEVAFSLGGGFAYETRTYFRTIEAKKQKEVVQKWLTELGTSNALDSCTIGGLFSPGTPLVIKASFSNPNQIITRNDDWYIRLFTLFDTYYKTYDTLRVEPFVTLRSVDDTETVTVLSSGAEVSPSFECRACDNALYSVRCNETVRPDTAILQRVTHVNIVSLDRDSMRAIYPDILASNRISESGVSVVRKGGGKPAQAAAKKKSGGKTRRR